MKNTKKRLIGLCAVILVIVLTYLFAWIQLHNNAKKYYNEAAVSYAAGNFMAALKGEKIITESDQGYIYKGGFEQVVNIYKSKYAYPKPGIYDDAKKRINEIIYEKITPELGFKIYKKYFKIDNAYLGEILLRSGDLYLKQGDREKAVEMYTLATESFPLNDEIYNKAVLNINRMQKKETK